MAAFLFARALHKAKEFYLASNVDGAGAFDDLVLRYRMREPDIWKTCFIQLEHKKHEGTIKLSSLTKMSGDFSLFKYFESYCQIKIKVTKDRNLKQCAPFDDFEFVIYTNARVEGNCTLQGGDSDPVSLLSSGPNYGKYKTFDKNFDTKILNFFNELTEYHDFIVELDSLLKRGTVVDEEINDRIESVQSSVTTDEILGKLNRQKSTLNTDCVIELIKELGKCDFTLIKEFLSKVKILYFRTNQMKKR